MFALSLLAFLVSSALCAERLHRGGPFGVAASWLVTGGSFGWLLLSRPMTPGTGLIAFLALDVSVVALSVLAVIRLLDMPHPAADGRAGTDEGGGPGGDGEDDGPRPSLDAAALPSGPIDWDGFDQQRTAWTRPATPA